MLDLQSQERNKSPVIVDVHIIVMTSQCHFDPLYCISDTKAAFGGLPPLWVYTLVSKPLLILRGLQGFRDMYQLSLKAALEHCQFDSSEAKGKKHDFQGFIQLEGKVQYESILR